MQYTYPEIRDVFTICAEAVAPDLRTNRGYIRPRSDGMGKILQNILSMNGVEFELKPGALSIVSGANVQEIFFDFRFLKNRENPFKGRARRVVCLPYFRRLLRRFYPALGEKFALADFYFKPQILKP